MICLLFLASAIAQQYVIESCSAIEEQRRQARIDALTLERDQFAAQVDLLAKRLAAVPSPVATMTSPVLEHRYTRADLACAVITTKKYHATRAVAAKRAWARRCGAVIFVSADADASLPTTVIPHSEEGKIINQKVFGAFAELWRQHGAAETPRWFIKADDDTFMQLDNLLALLSRYDSSEHVYLGRAGEWRGVKYCGGGAGYVVSRALLRDWAPLIASCQRLPVGEDVSVGMCLRDKLRVEPRWHAGFYHRPPTFFLATDEGRKDHPEGLSPRPISFHSVSPDEQATLAYLLYDTVETPRGAWRNDPWPSTVATH